MSLVLSIIAACVSVGGFVVLAMGVWSVVKFDDVDALLASMVAGTLAQVVACMFVLGADLVQKYPRQ